MYKYRPWVQMLFLVTFFGLWRVGKMPLWMLLLGASFLLALGFGRFYCGWLCPINTLLTPIEWLAKKFSWVRRPTPQWAKGKVLRYLILMVLAALLALTMIRGVKLPLILLMVPLGIAVTLIYHPATWHRYLCPYGVLLSITGGRARTWLQVDRQSCSSCGLCLRVCPSEGVNLRGEGETAQVDPGHCLACLNCQEVCPKDAIHFGPPVTKVVNSRV